MSNTTQSQDKLASEGRASQTTALTVEQLNFQIKQLIEGQISTVWVRGEISNFKAHTSGHFYFSLKDTKSQISAVMFRGNNSRLRFRPADGLEVLARGRITVYEPRGNYQIVCDMMEPVGAGALQKAFEQLRDKLKAEGLFEAARKRPLPALPRHIAVVTSPTGAAIRDILNVLARRARGVRVTVVPTIVQGEGSGAQILQALQRALRLPVDVIIVGRGGGSMEDLWGFNDEALARAIAQSPVPIISAVGHEIDFTISDFVADVRAPTPSAAAELVARSTQELEGRLTQLMRMLVMSIKSRLGEIRQTARSLNQRLIDPRQRLRDLALRNDDLMDRLALAMDNLIKDRAYRVKLAAQRLPRPDQWISRYRQRIEMALLKLRTGTQKAIEKRQARVAAAASLLDSLSPLKVLERGYSIVFKGKSVVRSASQVKAGDDLKLRLTDGDIEVKVTKIGGPGGL